MKQFYSDRQIKELRIRMNQYFGIHLQFVPEWIEVLHGELYRLMELVK